MSCGKCDKSKGLCPLSFGVALGIVSAVTVLIWSLWILVYGMPPVMAEHMPMPTVAGAFLHALLMLIKGFLFGFFLALIYDLLICCCKCKCCKKSEGVCMPDKPEAGKQI